MRKRASFQDRKNERINCNMQENYLDNDGFPFPEFDSWVESYFRHIEKNDTNYGDQQTINAAANLYTDVNIHVVSTLGAGVASTLQVIRVMLRPLSI